MDRQDTFKLVAMVVIGDLLVFYTVQLLVPLVFPSAGLHALLRLKTMSSVNYGLLLVLFLPGLRARPYWQILLIYSVCVVIMTLVSSPTVLSLSNE